MNKTLPAFKPVELRDQLLSLLAVKMACKKNWLQIAASELLAFADGPSCSEDSRSAVEDLVHVGITAVVHQAACQEQTKAQ